jgi:hypothetical protein
MDADRATDIIAIKTGIEADGIYLWNSDLDIPRAPLHLMR